MVQIGAFQDMSGKNTKLTGCPTPFADQAGFWQASFLASDLGDDIAPKVNLIRDGVQKSGAVCAAGIAKTPERGFRSLRCAVNKADISACKDMRWPVRRAAFKGR